MPNINFPQNNNTAKTILYSNYLRFVNNPLAPQNQQLLYIPHSPPGPYPYLMPYSVVVNVI